MKKACMFLVVALVLMFIWIHSTMPESRSDHESIWFTDSVVNPLLNKLGVSAVSNQVVRKSAHVFEFFVLSCLAVFLWNGKFIRGVYTGFTVAFVDESIQFIAKRGSLISDVWIDLIGVFFGVSFGWMLWKTVCLIRSHVEKTGRENTGASSE